MTSYPQHKYYLQAKRVCGRLELESFHPSHHLRINQVAATPAAVDTLKQTKDVTKVTYRHITFRLFTHTPSLLTFQSPLSWRWLDKRDKAARVPKLLRFFIKTQRSLNTLYLWQNKRKSALKREHKWFGDRLWLLWGKRPTPRNRCLWNENRMIKKK